MTVDLERKRWAQSIRRQVRIMAGGDGVPTGVSLMWVGDNVRRPGDVVAPGQDALTDGDVRANVREAILEHEALFSGFARADATAGLVVLVVASRLGSEAWQADLEVAGLGPWQPFEGSDESLGALMVKAIEDGLRARATS